MKAFILAAGLGTRLKPLTDTKPKALIEINYVPLLEIIIRRLIKYEFNEIVINVHHFADQIIDFIEKKKFDAEIHISDESDLLLDTGGGLKKASYFFNDGFPFLIHNVDILSDIDLKDFYEYHKKQNAIATIAVQKRNSSRYFLFDNNNNLCGWKNSKTSETKLIRTSSSPFKEYAFSGIHVVNPDIFKYFPDNDVFSIIDFYLAVAVEKRITFYDHSKNFLLDLGKKENLRKAEIFLTTSNFLKELK